MHPDARRTWLRLTALPPGLLVVGVLVLNAAGWIIDSSSLPRADGSWGYVVAAFVLGVYALPVLAFMVFCAVMGAVFSEAHERAACAWVSAGTASATGLLLAALVFAGLADSPAGRAFSAVALGVVVMLQVPLVVCRRFSTGMRPRVAGTPLQSAGLPHGEQGRAAAKQGDP